MADRDDTYACSVRVRDGKLSLSRVHDRLHLVFRSDHHRVPVTIPIEAETARAFFGPGYEIVRLLCAELEDR